MKGDAKGGSRKQCNNIVNSQMMETRMHSSQYIGVHSSGAGSSAACGYTALSCPHSASSARMSTLSALSKAMVELAGLASAAPPRSSTVTRPPTKLGGLPGRGVSERSPVSRISTLRLLRLVTVMWSAMRESAAASRT